MEDLLCEIKDWIVKVGLTEQHPVTQIIKILEELEEVSVEYEKEIWGRGDTAKLQTEIGDVVIAIITLSLQLNLDFEECLRKAHEKNARRSIDRVYRDLPADVR